MLIMQNTDIEFELLHWVPIPPDLKDGLSDQTIPKRKLKIWVVVLQSRKIQYRCEKIGNKYQLLVPVNQYQNACKELHQYEQENRNWPPPLPPERKLQQNTATTIWVFILLAIFHNITISHTSLIGIDPFDWLEQGNANASKILQGEWWRLITALTLHSGTLHLISNIVLGGIFMVRLCHLLGSGSAWFLVIFAGALGNLLNAQIQPLSHQSIGASTAVFGAVGLLAAINMLHFRTNQLRNWKLPFAAALGLLALLGSSGENTDIGAHLFGFISGVGLGLIAGSLSTKLPQQINRTLPWLSVFMITAAWWCAF